VCAYHYTFVVHIQYRTVLIIFSLILQKIIIAQMLSMERRESREDW